MPALLKSLDKAGFAAEKGEFSFWDLVQQTCKGVIPDTLANNPWPNTYIAAKFAEGGELPGIDRYWQLREDEAIVLVGTTAPPAAYFSYQTVMITRGDDPDTAIDEQQVRLGIPVGDTVNIGTVRTIGPDTHEQPIVYIITGNRETERLVRAAVLKAGYPASIINVETISPIIAPLGRGKAGSFFAFVHRVAVPVDKPAVETYAKEPPYDIFRVTPVDPATGEVGTEVVLPLEGNEEPVPTLRVRGTGQTEWSLYPALKRLRAAILATHGQALPYRELDTKLWELVTPNGRELKMPDPYVGLQRGYQVLGGTHDTNYLATYPNFLLRQNEEEFVIVYGVNHAKTGKATYSSFSLYADTDRWFGMKDGTTLSPAFEGSAEQYLPGDPDAQYLYAYKVARDCGDEEFCMTAQEGFIDIDGNEFACDLYDYYGDGHKIGPFVLDQAEMFFLFRSYMEPATNVAPDDNELLYDRAVYFGPYFNEP